VGKCRFDVTGDACGPFQIHEGYWTDCGSPGGGRLYSGGGGKAHAVCRIKV